MSAEGNRSFLSEDSWADLIGDIRDRQVIPVVGPELVTVEEAGARVPLNRWLAPRLAARLRLENPTRFSRLNDVACAYLLSPGNERKKIYDGIRRLLPDEPRLEAPPALVQLAEITDFDLFVTSTFDPLLAFAIEKTRPGFASSRDVLVYDMNPGKSLPDPLPGAFVYHILGHLKTQPVFAVWEEDYIEYLCHFIEQRGDEWLAPLLGELRRRHLLLLGAPFSDWIVRLFLRAARGQRLSDQRASVEYLTDRRENLGEPTIFFFSHLAKATRVIEGDPGEFVTELHRRWRQSRDVSGSARDFLERLAEEMPRGAVFISYSRDDEAAASSLALRLATSNVPVWLDKQRLRVGHNYERNLEYAVRDGCSFFVSLISAATERNAERYVHRERAWAASRFQEGFVFYVPVVIDDTPSSAIRLEPACFAKIHRERLPAGEPTDAFIQRMRYLVETWRVSGRPRD